MLKTNVTVKTPFYILPPTPVADPGRAKGAPAPLNSGQCIPITYSLPHSHSRVVGVAQWFFSPPPQRKFWICHCYPPPPPMHDVHSCQNTALFTHFYIHTWVLCVQLSEPTGSSTLGKYPVIKELPLISMLNQIQCQILS